MVFFKIRKCSFGSVVDLPVGSVLGSVVVVAVATVAGAIKKKEQKVNKQINETTYLTYSVVSWVT